MSRLKIVCLSLYVALCYFQAQGADKYTDENRPYEFGFTIDGEQHRHEKKDENGIIMGEFGFITADGVYHVTVYATDENGNFKIISMKNIRVKPYPTAPGTRISAERKGHSLALPPPPSQTIPHTSTKTQPTNQELNSSLQACSHCKLVTTTTTTSPRPKLTSSVVSPTNYDKQLRIAGAGNSQKNSQKYNNQQVNSQYGKSLAQSAQPNFEQNYQRGAISSQTQQNILNPSPSYPNQAVNVINQERFSQNAPSQPNYQDEFNVGRKYLQKTQGQQQLSVGPNSILQPNAGLNYQQGFNAEQQQQQGIIDGQYNLQPPYHNNQPFSTPPQSYPQQAGTKIQDSGAPELGQNYPSDTEQKYVQGSNTKDNQYIQNEIYQNKPRISQTIDTPVQGTIPGDREPKTFTDILQTINPEQHYKSTGTPSNSYASSQQNIGKPVLVAAQMQVVDKNTNIYQKNPGEDEGLPKGLTKTDMTELLYTFNYTVGFHSHHEEGYRSGVKIGYYYVTGRNGIRTRVDYTADETGFHPRISQEVLDIQSDEVPKPETEKDEKYGLKGYEFKWLYYPIDSK
ncbi:protein lethal(3)malignant blood neoplasm 1-like [Maniola hyperantus]|uniref:protein lethal(3)malignant blood neoplasm 1-like n=1 Tax=Aphantopus hyperantus TaxID=2795564 RepID=UPI0015691B4C|nr:uncharacterized protein LOC117982371 [Maniola hyperantus]XP_034824616.1 uncharacterized protein LOC117982371 [Maniola hyperantus]XP_034824617.1 uncharacterized protein LOC117982371 [Maniola hyperantus]